MPRRAEARAQVLPPDPLGLRKPLRAGDVLAVRRRLGLTQNEMALLLGVHWTSLTNWEARPLSRQLAICGGLARDIRALIYAANERGDDLVEEIRACLDAELETENGVEQARALAVVYQVVIGQW